MTAATTTAREIADGLEVTIDTIEVNTNPGLLRKLGRKMKANPIKTGIGVVSLVGAGAYAGVRMYMDPSAETATEAASDVASAFSALFG